MLNTAKRKRETAVFQYLLGSAMILGGLWFAFWGTVWVVGWENDAYVFCMGFCLLLLAAMLFVSAIGLMLQKNWARLLAIIALILVILIVVWFLSGAISDYFSGLEPDDIDVTREFILVYGIVFFCTLLGLVYLMQPRTKRRFIGKSRRKSKTIH